MKADCVPIFSSDGLKHYFYALTAHFGEWNVPEGESKPVWLILTSFLYAQVIKQQKRFRLVGVEHRLLWRVLDEYRARLKSDGLSGNINTSFVERANLTIRQSVSKLTRRTWGQRSSHRSWKNICIGGWRTITSYVHMRVCALDYRSRYRERGSKYRGNTRR